MFFAKLVISEKKQVIKKEKSTLDIPKVDFLKSSSIKAILRLRSL